MSGHMPVIARKACFSDIETESTEYQYLSYSELSRAASISKFVVYQTESVCAFTLKIKPRCLKPRHTTAAELQIHAASSFERQNTCFGPKVDWVKPPVVCVVCLLSKKNPNKPMCNPIRFEFGSLIWNLYLKEYVTYVTLKLNPSLLGTCHHETALGTFIEASHWNPSFGNFLLDLHLLPVRWELFTFTRTFFLEPLYGIATILELFLQLSIFTGTFNL